MGHRTFIFSDSPDDSAHVFLKKLEQVCPYWNNLPASFRSDHGNGFEELWPNFNDSNLSSILLDGSEEMIHTPSTYGVWTYELRIPYAAVPPPQEFIKNERARTLELAKVGLRNSPDGQIIRNDPDFQGGTPCERMIELIDEATQSWPPDKIEEIQSPPDDPASKQETTENSRIASADLVEPIPSIEELIADNSTENRASELPDSISAKCRACKSGISYPSKQLLEVLSSAAIFYDLTNPASLTTATCVFCADQETEWSIA